MKRIIVIVLIGIGFFLLIPSINIKDRSKVTQKKEEQVKTIDSDIDEYLNKMTIEEKIAQMLIIEYNGTYLDDNLKDIIANRAPGGFIITKNNITTYENTKKFIDDIKEQSDLPFIFSMDQEGGNVQRLKYITDIEVPEIPYMYDVGLSDDSDHAYDIGEVIASQLRTIGINVVFAPVLDIYSNPNNTVIGKRSFGKDPKLVSKMAISLAKGIEDNGVIATYKHFPGHGDTSIDSHISLPIVKKTKEEIEEFELVPFKKAIAEDAKIIMVGHLALPEITNDNTPATLSYDVVTKLLKEDLKYKGLVISDALDMGALTSNYTDEEIYIKTISAGIDLLLMPNDFDAAINIIKDNIDEDRIDESVKKILKFKLTYLNNYKPLDESYLNNEKINEVLNRF